MSDNLRIYNALRNVPNEAKKSIQGGRLKGMTDINPMWRIKALTERFGPCGIGWWYTIDKQWLEHGANDEIAAFCNITLYYREGDVVSQGTPGTGGSMFVAKEKGGLYTSDECYKMALTDAISVASKALGGGADVYWDKDRTKYDRPTENQKDDAPKLICIRCNNAVEGVKFKNGSMTANEIADHTKKHSGVCLCWRCFKTNNRSYERDDAYAHEDAGDRI